VTRSQRPVWPGSIRRAARECRWPRGLRVLCAIRLIEGGVGDPGTDMPAKEVADMLASAVHGETHEYTDMYPGMAKTAREEGFDEIADWFETLAKAERSHANRYQKAMDSL